MISFIKLLLRTFGYESGQEIPEMHLLHLWLAPQYLEPQTMQRLRREFQKTKPFPHAVLPHFFQEAQVEEVKKAVLQEKFTEKHADLFSFFQTADFQSTQQRKLQAFHQFLQSVPFQMYMRYVTGFQFAPRKVDCAATLYEDTHFLLPHDDRLDTRKLAFMLYLSDMRKRSGGALQLYEKQRVVKQILPATNAFVYFAVSKDSLHGVQEVVGRAKRLTIGGWYHAR